MLRVDEEVPVHFDPLQILTRAEATAARRFTDEADLMGSETAAPNLFGGQAEAETAVGTISAVLDQDSVSQRVLLIL
jgi:hypothetical protein